METKKAKEVLANAPEGATHYKETKNSKTYYKVTTDKSDPIFGNVVIAEFWCKYSDLWRPSSFFKKEGAYKLNDIKCSAESSPMITVKQFLDAGFRLHIGDIITNNHHKTDVELTDSSKSAPVWAERYAVDGVDLSVKSLAWRKNEGKQPVKDGLPLTIEDTDGNTACYESNVFDWSIDILGCKIKQWKPNLAALEQQMNDKQDMMTQAESDDIEHLEKSALEMSERDVPSFDEPIIVNPFDACASNEDGDVVEWDGKGLPPVGVECDILKPDGEGNVIGRGKIYFVDRNSVPVKVFILSDFINSYPKESTVEGFDGKLNLYVMYIHEETRFRKIESPQEKAKREREEDLNRIANTVFQCDWLDIHKSDRHIISKLYDAGYRKN